MSTQRSERLEFDAVEGEGIRSAIHHGRFFALVGIAFRELVEVFAEVGAECCGGLDLRRKELPSRMFNHVHLHAIGIAVKIDVGAFSRVERLFHLFKNDKVLKETAAKGVMHQLRNGLDFCQGAGESRVVEIDLGRLDETLATVLVPGRQKKADVRCVEDGKPFHHRFRGDAAVIREGRDVKHGTDAPDEQLEEGGEKHCIFDIEKLVDVSFHVCGGVIVEKVRDLLLVDDISWVSAAENTGQGICTVNNSGGFLHAEREKREYGTSSRECLGDILHEKKIAGTGEDEKSVLSLVIDNSLNVGEKIGYALHFIENGPIRKLGEKSLRVAFGHRSRARMFKRPVWLVRKQFFCKRHLARLPRSHYRDNGIVVKGGPDGGFYVSFDFHAAHSITTLDFMQYEKLTSRIA